MDQKPQSEWSPRQGYNACATVWPPRTESAHLQASVLHVGRTPYCARIVVLDNPPANASVKKPLKSHPTPTVSWIEGDMHESVSVSSNRARAPPPVTSSSANASRTLLHGGDMLPRLSLSPRVCLRDAPLFKSAGGCLRQQTPATLRPSDRYVRGRLDYCAVLVR